MNLPSKTHNAKKHQQLKCLCICGINAVISDLFHQFSTDEIQNLTRNAQTGR